MNAVETLFFLTSVGHEYLQSRVLEQVPPRKHGTDLGEDPFPMQTFGISKNLKDSKKKKMKMQSREELKTKQIRDGTEGVNDD